MHVNTVVVGKTNQCLLVIHLVAISVESGGGGQSWFKAQNLRFTTHNVGFV